MIKQHKDYSRPLFVLLLCASGVVSARAIAQEGEPVTIGAAVAQSGVASQFDIPPMQMVQIAIDDLNAAGGILGRHVRLVVADTASKVEQGRVAARQVIDAGANFVLVTCDFDFDSPAASAAQEAGIVVFSLCAQLPKFAVQGIGPLAYTGAPATYNEGGVLSQFAQKRAGISAPFLPLDDIIAYDVEVCDGFRNHWTAAGREIAGEAFYKNDDATIRSQSNQIIRSGADAVVICGYTPGAPSAMRQLRSAASEALSWLPTRLTAPSGSTPLPTFPTFT